MSMHIIVIDGHDNLGKTDLASKISLRYNARYMHSSIPQKASDKIHEAYSIFDEFKKHQNLLFVLDRSFWNDSIYGNLYRGYQQDFTSINKLFKHESENQNLKFLFIVLYADELTYSKFNYISKHDENHKFQKPESAKFISTKLFSLYSDISFGKKLFINCNNYKSLDDRNVIITEYIDSFVKNRVHRLPHRTVDDKLKTSDFSHIIFNNEMNSYTDNNGIFDQSFECKSTICKQTHKFAYIGNIKNAKYLFVGEMPHYGISSNLPWYGGVSSNLFQSMLYELEIPLTRCAATNTIACAVLQNDLGKYSDIRNRKELNCVKEVLKNTVDAMPLKCKIVALGSIADSTLHMIGCTNVIKTNHPAYFIRTGNSRMYFSYMRKKLFGV